MCKKMTGALIALMALAMSISLGPGDPPARPRSRVLRPIKAPHTKPRQCGRPGSVRPDQPDSLGGCGTPTPPGYFASATTGTVNIPNALQTGVITTTVVHRPGQRTFW